MPKKFFFQNRKDYKNMHVLSSTLFRHRCQINDGDINVNIDVFASMTCFVPSKFATARLDVWVQSEELTTALYSSARDVACYVTRRKDIWSLNRAAAIIGTVQFKTALIHESYRRKWGRLHWFVCTVRIQREAVDSFLDKRKTEKSTPHLPELIMVPNKERNEL